MLDGRTGTFTAKWGRTVGIEQITTDTVYKVDVQGAFQYSDSDGHDAEVLILVELESGQLVVVSPRELVMDK